MDEIHLIDFSGISKFKSVRRAIRRGHASPLGFVYPNRPFKNINNHPKSVTTKRRKVYESVLGSRKAQLQLAMGQ